MVTGFLFCLETRNELQNYTVYYQVQLRVSDIDFEKLFQSVSFFDGPQEVRDIATEGRYVVN